MKVDSIRKNQFKHVCPRNCYSSCTMVSYVENDRIVHIAADPSHPYSQGKLCAKGYSYIERNYHRDRLKFPYYQEVKGSGKFKQITWEKAYELIINEMMEIYHHSGSFKPLAFYKGAGNTGVHHYVANHFFDSMKGAAQMTGAFVSGTGFEPVHRETDSARMFDPSFISKSDLIVIWGANPAATNIHLIPLLIQARIKGAKIVVVDPLYTQSAELADLYIQIKPSTDGALANLLLKELLAADVIDHDFLEGYTVGFDEFMIGLKEINEREYLERCGISEEAFALFYSWLKEAQAVSHIIGVGMQRYANSGQNIRVIEALGVIRGDLGKTNGGVFLGNHADSRFFNNQQQASEHQVLNFYKKGSSGSEEKPIEMLWISCGNPVNQEPDSQWIKRYLEEIPFVVTVDQFFTPTAQMSNLVLPTTTHFEEWDIVTNLWHGGIALNEKAVSPYFQSHSEWRIMSELAARLNEIDPNLCLFPVYASEEDYLNAQFNDKVRERYHVESISDLKGKIAVPGNSQRVWSDNSLSTETGKYQFYSNEAEQKGYPTLPLFAEGKSPTEEFPLWLLTPHHPYMFNSQFHFLDLTEEGEAYVGIHPKTAKERRIYDGEVVRVFNDQASLEIKAVYSTQVPRDILFIYQGWYSDSEVNVNQLVAFEGGGRCEGHPAPADISDVFVNVRRL